MEELIRENAALDLDLSSAQYIERPNICDIHYRYAQLRKGELYKNEEAF